MYKRYYPDDSLEHSAKGSQKKNHKYLSRVWKNGKWLYQYAKDKYTGEEYKRQIDRNNKDQEWYDAYVENIGKDQKEQHKQYLQSKKDYKEGEKNALDRLDKAAINEQEAWREFKRNPNAETKKKYGAAMIERTHAKKNAKDTIKKLNEEREWSRTMSRDWGSMYTRKLAENTKRKAETKKKNAELQKKYDNAPMHKVKKAKATVAKGEAAIKKFFNKSKPKVTVTDTFTGKKRTPKKPKSSSDTVNIKELSKKNKKK